ncbi:T9SS type A sorting domain-containing protein [Aureibacter tunicatorum]|uniref:Secretion system C-terminal sorting domain-containing protein n=1 Tax=Aureibacter tunicatorum TaxID=866807 RepID=A0AAE3XRW1_9BACT|nr:T9SS type A sorting domain-containing protein [Aureibacter tunicatorum]MDR6240334.1 hypothetical protein [Aureibacter tunicatorum]BDD05785.1 hypothetical protein AUTU_32680 [Aureibacter tunicatorum]
MKRTCLLALLCLVFCVSKSKAQTLDLPPKPVANTFRVDFAWFGYPLNQVTIPSSHNTFSADRDGFGVAKNHIRGFQDQLSYGMTGIELDYHKPLFGSKIIIAHYGIGERVPWGWPYKDLEFYLQRISQSLANDPNKYLVVKNQMETRASDVEKVWNKYSDLKNYTYTIQSGYIPTLGEFLASGKRILHTSSINGNYQSHVIRTATSNKRQNVSDVYAYDAIYRGKHQVDFYDLNAFAVSDLIGAGDEEKAKVLNAYDNLLRYSLIAWKLSGKKPWQLVVDFESKGDVYAVATVLNNEYKSYRGEVVYNGSVLSEVAWEFDYEFNQDTLSGNTVTYGRFSFPVGSRDGKVVIKPVSDIYEFEPAEVELDFASASTEVFNLIEAKLKNSAGRKSFANEKLSLQQTVDEALFAEFKLYPNPAENTLNIDMPEFEGNATISIIDLLGRVQATKTIDKNTRSYRLDLKSHSINEGTYLVVCQFGEQKISRKLVVK